MKQINKQILSAKELSEYYCISLSRIYKSVESDPFFTPKIKIGNRIFYRKCDADAVLTKLGLMSKGDQNEN